MAFYIELDELEKPTDLRKFSVGISFSKGDISIDIYFNQSFYTIGYLWGK